MDSTQQLTQYIQVSVEELKKSIHIPDEQIRKEMLEIMKLCGIPEEKAPLLEHALKEHIKNTAKRMGLCEEKWLIDALYNILIHTTYIMNKYSKQCIFNHDLSIQP